MSATAPTQASDEAERTARHMRLAREMGELAIGLARAVAARAERDLATAPDSPLSAETATPNRRNANNPLLLFTRLCKIVEIALALEARLAKGLTPVIPKARAAASPAAEPASPANPLPRASLLAGTSLASPAFTPPWPPKPAAPLDPAGR